jgi:hypothetical protein
MTMFYSAPRHRCPVDERVIFERLWRGAFCQALGTKHARAAPRRQCCCHCHCNSELASTGAFYVRPTQPKKTMRSVVR